MSGPVVGIDLGGTNMQVGVVSAPDGDTPGALVGRAKLKTKADEGQDAVIARVVEGIEEACGDAGLKPADLAAVGLGAPGAIEARSGIVLEAPNLRWNDVPLGDLLSEKLGVPAVIDNDVNVALVGEHERGAGAGCSHLLAVWIGTGIGGAMMFDHELYHGHYNTAGEIGHMTYNPGAAPGHRSIEHNASRTVIVNRLEHLIRCNRPSVITELVGDRFDKVKSKTLAQAYGSGDALTVEVIDDAAERLGTHIAGVVTLLSLECVVLGGGLTEAIGEPLVTRVRESFERFVFPDRLRQCRIVASELEDDAGIYGAASLARRRLAAT